MSCCCKKTHDLRFSSPNEDSCLQVFCDDSTVQASGSDAGTSGSIVLSTCVVKTRSLENPLCSYSVFSFCDASPEFLEIFVKSFAQHKKANSFKRGEPSKYDDITALAPFFHLPLDHAAAAIGICPTLLKRAARKNGLKKWPYRKLSSIRKLQSRLKATRDTHSSASQCRALDIRIDELQKEIDAICFNVPPAVAV